MCFRSGASPDISSPSCSQQTGAGSSLVSEPLSSLCMQCCKTSSPGPVGSQFNCTRSKVATSAVSCSGFLDQRSWDKSCTNVATLLPASLAYILAHHCTPVFRPSKFPYRCMKQSFFGNLEICSIPFNYMCITVSAVLSAEVLKRWSKCLLLK